MADPVASNESAVALPDSAPNFSLWPRGIGLSTPSLKDANYFAWLLFLALLAAPALVVLIYFSIQGKLGDFAYFYGDGILANLYLLDFMVQTGRKPTQLLQLLFDKVGEHYYDRIDTPLANMEMRTEAKTRLDETR